MRRANRLIGASAVIAALLAVATITTFPTHRSASHALDGRGVGDRACWFDPDVPRCD